METVRPGRTIELVEATVVIGARAVVRAHAWFLAELDTAAVAGTRDGRIPGAPGVAQQPARFKEAARGSHQRLHPAMQTFSHLLRVIRALKERWRAPRAD